MLTKQSLLITVFALQAEEERGEKQIGFFSSFADDIFYCHPAHRLGRGALFSDNLFGRRFAHRAIADFCQTDAVAPGSKTRKCKPQVGP